MILSKYKFLSLTAAVLAVSLLSFGVARADTVGEHHDFFDNSSFDLNGRSSLPATLELVANHAYYYVDDQYLDSLSSDERTAMMQQLVGLANEFDNNIYPKETAFWGSEADPGIDGDAHITVLLEELKSGTGGYFDSSNGYPTSVAPNSNEREMLILNADSLNQGHLDAFLAHEMQHLISFNQKDLLHHVTE
ncbi:MAG TPA: hypothetical protein VFK07_01070, partial [Candidatus Paceibacterota bacterium]|nr:hypothetical protein [Candidatus Paceibacterota bacterium]